MADAKDIRDAIISKIHTTVSHVLGETDTGNLGSVGIHLRARCSTRKTSRATAGSGPVATPGGTTTRKTSIKRQTVPGVTAAAEEATVTTKETAVTTEETQTTAEEGVVALEESRAATEQTTTTAEEATAGDAGDAAHERDRDAKDT